MNDLKLTLIQTNIIWENCLDNLKRYETNYLSKLKTDETDLILFPELFTTGFTMNTKQFSEKMDGKTIQWMQSWAEKLNTQIGGSLIIEIDQNYYNRFVIVSKHGVETYYDKNHLFRMGNENNHFTKGTKRVIYTIKGWKLLLQVCYDLRFPVFSRNQTIEDQKEYDAVIYIANWPEIRSEIWTTLLKARAIENQAYCIGVNRVGKDGNEITHSGNSTNVSPWGKGEFLKPNAELMKTITLKKEILDDINTKFPAFLDSNPFQLTVK